MDRSKNKCAFSSVWTPFGAKTALLCITPRGGAGRISAASVCVPHAKRSAKFRETR
jgi:hypothetical protein